MRITKFIVPAVAACIMALTSCNGSGTPLTTAEECATATVDVISATKDKIDNIGLNAELSNVSGDVVVRRFTVEDTRLTDSETVRVIVENGAVNLGLKLANIVADGKEGMLEGKTKTSYFKGYVDLSNLSAKGRFDVSNYIDKSTEAYGLDYDINASKLIGYYNESQLHDIWNSLYIEANDKNALNSIEGLINNAKSKKASDTDFYAKLIITLQTICSAINANMGKIVASKISDRSVITAISEKIFNFVDKFDVESAKVIANTIYTILFKSVSELGLSSNAFTVSKKNGKALDITFNLDKNNLNKLIDAFKPLIKEDVITIPHASEGGLKLIIKANSDGLISNVEINFDSLKLEDKIEFKDTFSSNFDIDQIYINKLSGDFKITTDYNVTLEQVEKLLEPSTKDIFQPIDF